jgi:putative DNA primase/helicase
MWQRLDRRRGASRQPPSLSTTLCAPGFLVNAPSYSGAGTGKALLLKACVITGSGIRPTAFKSGHDDKEFDKRLTACLVEARPCILLDNFNAKNLQSDVLASALTEPLMMVRLFGKTKNVPLFTRTFIAVTGNGVQIAEDIARRVFVTDLDSEMENPEQRPFKPGFLDDVHARRTELLTAALTIWRYGRQNDLKGGKSIGNYEVWARWVRDPLLSLGCRDPVERIAEGVGPEEEGYPGGLRDLVGVPRE